MTNKISIIKFFGTWCNPCVKLAPIIEEIHQENPSLLIQEIDVDTNREMVKKYNIKSIPCLIFLKNDIEMERIVGLTTKSSIMETLSKIN